MNFEKKVGRRQRGGPETTENLTIGQILFRRCENSGTVLGRRHIWEGKVLKRKNLGKYRETDYDMGNSVELNIPRILYGREEHN